LNGFPIPKLAIGKPSLCLNRSATIPKFVLGSLRDKLQLGGAIDYLSLTIAAWCHYLNGCDDQNRPIPIDDPLADSLTQKARSGKTDPRPFLSIFEIFGDLVESPGFLETIADKLSNLHEFGDRGTLARFSSALSASVRKLI
jgi:mannitol 2-dehydrogenase